MNIVEPQVLQYLNCMIPERHPVLHEMERYAEEKRFPIIGPLVGRFLQQLVTMTRAKRIFEMGSGYGYSAAWMALALPDDGKIECCEFKDENIECGRTYLQRLGVGDRVDWHSGDALETMANTSETFDLILNDVDKHQYPKSLEIAWPRLRNGGVFVTDNALWSGRIVSEDPPSKSTSGVLRVNKDAYALEDAIASIIPLRDGLLLLVKK